MKIVILDAKTLGDDLDLSPLDTLWGSDLLSDHFPG